MPMSSDPQRVDEAKRLIGKYSNDLGVDREILKGALDIFETVSKITVISKSNFERLAIGSIAYAKMKIDDEFFTDRQITDKMKKRPYYVKLAYDEIESILARSK